MPASFRQMSRARLIRPPPSTAFAKCALEVRKALWRASEWKNAGYWHASVSTPMQYHQPHLDEVSKSGDADTRRRVLLLRDTTFRPTAGHVHYKQVRG